jgi:uncharacterized protein (DUF736 family)
MNIGSTNTARNGGFLGSIATLALSIEVAFVPNASTNPTAPRYRIKARPMKSQGPWAEVGALFPAKSQNGLAFLQGKIDDPSLSQPLYLAAFDRVNSETGEVEGHNIAWSRPSGSKASALEADGSVMSKPAAQTSDDGLGESDAFNTADDDINF